LKYHPKIGPAAMPRQVPSLPCEPSKSVTVTSCKFLLDTQRAVDLSTAGDGRTLKIEGGHPTHPTVTADMVQTDEQLSGPRRGCRRRAGSLAEDRERTVRPTAKWDDP